MRARYGRSIKGPILSSYRSYRVKADMTGNGRLPDSAHERIVPDAAAPEEMMFTSRSTCMILVMMALCSCMRTSDGTVVPKYEMTVSRRGWIPRVAIHKAELAAPPQVAPFEPAPLPEVDNSRARTPTHRHRPKPSRAAETQKPSIKPAQSRTLHCNEQKTADGRQRVICL
jgi:hypothetical protein